MGLGIGFIGSTTRHHVEFVSLHYPIIDQKLRLAVTTIKNPANAKICGGGSNDRPSWNWLKTDAGRVIRNGNIVHADTADYIGLSSRS